MGILYFASLPALAARSLATAAVRGGAFGFFTYMTYELTNHATLRLWSWNLVVIDTLWGAALTAVSAGSGRRSGALVQRAPGVTGVACR